MIAIMPEAYTYSNQLNWAYKNKDTEVFVTGNVYDKEKTFWDAMAQNLKLVSEHEGSFVTLDTYAYEGNYKEMAQIAKNTIDEGKKIMLIVGFESVEALRNLSYEIDATQWPGNITVAIKPDGKMYEFMSKILNPELFYYLSNVGRVRRRLIDILGEEHG